MIKHFIKINFLFYFILFFSTHVFAQSISLDICPQIKYKDISFYYYEPYLIVLILFNDEFELFELNEEYNMLINKNSEYLNEKSNELIQFFINYSDKYKGFTLDKNRLNDRTYLIHKIKSYLFYKENFTRYVSTMYKYCQPPIDKEKDNILKFLFQDNESNWFLFLYDIFREINENKDFKEFFDNYHNKLYAIIKNQIPDPSVSQFMKYYNIKLKKDYSIPILFSFKIYDMLNTNKTENNDELALNNNFIGFCSSNLSIVININLLSKDKGRFQYIFYHEFTHFFQLINGYYKGPEIKTESLIFNETDVYSWYKYIRYLFDNLNVCEFDADFCSLNFLKQNGEIKDFLLNSDNKELYIYEKIMYYLSYLYSNYDLENNKNKYSLLNFSESKINTDFKDSINEFLKNEIKPNLSMIIKKIKPIMDYYQSFEESFYI